MHVDSSPSHSSRRGHISDKVVDLARYLRGRRTQSTRQPLERHHGSTKGDRTPSGRTVRSKSCARMDLPAFQTFAVPATNVVRNPLTTDLPFRGRAYSRKSMPVGQTPTTDLIFHPPRCASDNVLAREATTEAPGLHRLAALVQSGPAVL